MPRFHLDRSLRLFMAAFFVLGGFLFVGSSVKAATMYISSNITTSTTFTSGNVYVIQSAPEVTAGGKLTINSGTVVKFDATELFIAASGTLIVNGTAASPVYFTSLNDNSVGGTITGSTRQSCPGGLGHHRI